MSLLVAACTPYRASYLPSLAAGALRSWKRTRFECIASALQPVRLSPSLRLWISSFIRHSDLCPADTKFFVIADPNHADLDSFLQRVYTLYADYVLKNPFYELEQPIRCEQFDM
jgi:hypothetical protein